MPHRFTRATLALLLLAAAHAPRAGAAGQSVEQLTVYDAGVAQFVEVRALELQTGLNTVEWRSLMPQAFIRTLRVVAEGAEVVRQDVTYDGPEVRGGRAPVLHLVLRSSGAPGARRVQVDYLAPNLGWQNDYTLVLAPAQAGAPPTTASLDSWVSLLNSTGVDLTARRVDLIAGEIALINTAGGGGRFDASMNVSQRASGSATDEISEAVSSAPAGALSAFSRFRLGEQISINANAPVNRFPLFQGARVAVVERHVFENDYNAQTFARGGFVLLPRGLEVRLVSRNTTGVPMPAGQVTIYARPADGSPAQIVGQDRVPLVAMNEEFSVSQGRSSTLLGTRRVLERRAESYRLADGRTDEKLLTRVEIVLTNRGARATEAFVRERVEPYDGNQWRVLESSAPAEPLGANLVQFRLRVPAGGTQTLTYTVETN
ncbi:MAG TPA: hypothetical protein VIP46_21230 [Pyrinomonadaceae bacterium]